MNQCSGVLDVKGSLTNYICKKKDIFVLSHGETIITNVLNCKTNHFCKMPFLKRKMIFFSHSGSIPIKNPIILTKSPSQSHPNELVKFIEKIRPLYRCYHYQNKASDNHHSQYLKLTKQLDSIQGTYQEFVK